jgi:DNA-directed RNA polymerase omega subunit
MARITVDDCLKRIPNRFQLTLTATYRARQQIGTEVLRRNQTPPAMAPVPAAPVAPPATET